MLLYVMIAIEILVLQESFSSGAVVIARVLIGEARFSMEPRQDECFGTCSTFKGNPVLKQGDARKLIASMKMFFRLKS